MPKDWLTSDAISNYVVFVAGVVVAVVAFFIRERLQRKKPSIILVEKEREASLLDIAPKARGFLQVTYNNENVSEFYQTTFRISNIGEESIQNAQLIFSFADSTDTITFVLEGSNPGRKVDVSTKQHAITLLIPFLNPEKEHNDYEQLQLYSSKRIEGIKVIGSGVGWSTRFVDRVEERNERIDNIYSLTAAMLKAALIKP